ncbi:MAG TPA: complex I subunit 5 family protein [Gaiellaceae bacterium]|nr:complex I subunit 5 family protein [Gaiellaceae bacterium]
MSWLPPLLVAIPLLAGAAIAGGDHVTPTPIQQAVAVAAAAATAALSALLLIHVESVEVVHWFGGWKPRGGIALGVDFAVDPFAAGMCLAAAVVVLLALVYSLTYMKEEARIVDALFLSALGAMCGFAMSGDLFNLFVWLELMGVSAFALTGFQARKLGPVQGAVNFAIVTTVGSFLLVLGIGFVYARTGALNLAQAGEALKGKPDGLVIVAMTLVLCGFLVKGAVAPFHLWAADAYAVAPGPVCAVLGGAMTDIGLFGVARSWWTVFSAPFHGHAAGDVLLWLGIVSALLGAVMALLQRHLKRLLAYSVIAHIGVMLAGIGMLEGKALAGSALVFVSHAFLTAALFLVAGLLLLDEGTIDELRLYGRGRAGLGAIWLAATIGLVGAPYVGIYLGHGLIDEAAAHAHREWIPPLLWLSSALVGAALLRAGGRIFLGRGDRADPLLGRELDEDPVTRDALRPLLVGATWVALALGVVVSVVPGIDRRVEHAADRFRDRTEYAGAVLHGTPIAPMPSLPFEVAHSSTETVLYAAGAVLLAFLLALVGLYRERLAGGVASFPARLLAPPVAALKALHSGVVGDYVTWVVVGTAAVGGAWALLLR